MTSPDELENALPSPLLTRLDLLVDRLCGYGLLVEASRGNAIPAAEVLRAELLAIACEMALAFLLVTRGKALEDAINAVCEYPDCVTEDHEQIRERIRALIKEQDPRL